MGLDLQPDLCSLLIDDVIYHEAAVRQAGAEALSQAVARYQRQAAEVMGRLMEIYQEKLYVSRLCTAMQSECVRVGWTIFNLPPAPNRSHTVAQGGLCLISRLTWVIGFIGESTAVH